MFGFDSIVNDLLQEALAWASFHLGLNPHLNGSHLHMVSVSDNYCNHETATSIYHRTTTPVVNDIALLRKPY